MRHNRGANEDALLYAVTPAVAWQPFICPPWNNDRASCRTSVPPSGWPGSWWSERVAGRSTLGSQSERLALPLQEGSSKSRFIAAPPSRHPVRLTSFLVLTLHFPMCSRRTFPPAPVIRSDRPLCPDFQTILSYSQPTGWVHPLTLLNWSRRSSFWGFFCFKKSKVARLVLLSMNSCQRDSCWNWNCESFLNHFSLWACFIY